MCTCILLLSDVWTKSCDCTQVIAVDVGQGSGLYIRTQEGKEMIIDTGETTKTLRNLSQFRYPWDRAVDVMFLTHADRDHIGMSIDLTRRNIIHAIVVPPIETSDVISNMLESEQNIVFAREGDSISFDEVNIQILWPEPITNSKKIDKNENSLVLLLTIGNTKILVMGDAGEPTEKELIAEYGSQLKSDILIVGHHGSKTSSSDEFITNVNPTYAVIQVGANNKFGHPHQSVLQTLLKYRAKILRSDNDGSIIFRINTSGITDIVGK